MTKGALLQTPDITEINNIIRRVEQLNKFRRRLPRKINDLRGNHSSDGIMRVLDEFITWCGKTLDINPFNATMFFNWHMRDERTISIKDGTWSNILNFVHMNGYINDTEYKINNRRFKTQKSAIKWIIAYRAAIMYFNKVIKNLNYDGSWITDDTNK